MPRLETAQTLSLAQFVDLRSRGRRPDARNAAGTGLSPIARLSSSNAPVRAHRSAATPTRALTKPPRPSPRRTPGPSAFSAPLSHPTASHQSVACHDFMATLLRSVVVIGTLHATPELLWSCRRRTCSADGLLSSVTRTTPPNEIPAYTSFGMAWHDGSIHNELSKYGNLEYGCSRLIGRNYPQYL